MKTKRNKGVEFAAKAGHLAMEYIGKTKPDVVIACDDNASKYLVKVHLRDSDTPVVFCGVNHSVKPYGYPYSNTTGMIEISPVRPLLELVKLSRPGLKKGVFLGPNVPSEMREYELSASIYKEPGRELIPLFAADSADYQAKFLQAQAYPVVALGSNGGIDDWNHEEMKQFMLKNTKTLVVSYMEWLRYYSAIVMAKVGEEQGCWSGQAATAILRGIEPSDIPIVTKQEWTLYVNSTRLDLGHVELPLNTLNRAILVKPE